ncbi:MAG: NAD(P)-dependent oxidoreductase [Actinobacteria bacterium]|nr:MAG: NAD(P)-dependent oxidoreductase [Actinomycetota bacterium]
MSERVGFIGLGIMGSRMAANVARAGFELTVFNRTRATAERFAQGHRAAVADSPAEVGAASDLVVTMVVDGRQVEEVLLGARGVIHGARGGTLCVDMSTIGRAWARRLGQRLGERGLAMLDAPVTGSAPRAEDGTLTIMVGGEPGDLDRARGLLGAMGSLIVPAGPLGNGQMVKLINNAVAAANAAVVAQALLVGAATGVDLDALEAVLRAGSGASTMLELKATPMREHDYRPLFKLAHMLKDIDLCLAEAGTAAVPFPAAAETRDLLAAAAAQGHAEDDFCALLEAVQVLAGRRL